MCQALWSTVHPPKWRFTPRVGVNLLGTSWCSPTAQYLSWYTPTHFYISPKSYVHNTYIKYSYNFYIWECNGIFILSISHYVSCTVVYTVISTLQLRYNGLLVGQFVVHWCVPTYRVNGLGVHCHRGKLTCYTSNITAAHSTLWPFSQLFLDYIMQF